MALRDNMVSWWSLDETSGTRNDAHGTNHLTDNNTVLSGTGKYSNAADFEFSNAEFLSITNAAQTGLGFNGSEWSISYWIKKESDTDGVSFGKGNSGQVTFYIQHDVSGTSVRFADSSETAFDWTSSESVGTWYHYVFVYSSGTLTLYKDGTSLGSKTVGTLTASTAYFSLGRVEKYASNYIDGLIDEAAVWSRAITSTEVTELYNGGAGLDYAGTAGGAVSAIKTINGLALASVKTVNGLSISSVKTVNGLA